jgi:threonylcarbamoyladenosine tRNA methylthiotransferase MtaB
MKIYFDSVGCRLNQAEIEKMAIEFRAAGHEIVEKAENADLVIVNTCAVTAAAASDSRQKIRQVNHLGVTKIVATGCWATLSPTEAKGLPGVSDVILNSDKDNLVKKILGGVKEIYDLEPLERVPLPGIHRRTRAFIKVQDGCNNFCTYCVTRIARGKSISMNKQAILDEILSAEKGGAQEIVLSGVHLGCWGRDFEEKETISDLISYLLKVTSIPRIRLSSIEPWDLDEQFFDLWENSRLCQHFHLPLQSGCESTLKRMSRHTTPDLYGRLVTMIRSRMPDAAITTDIIVGFPGESDTDHLESIEFVKRMQFSDGHVFRFSPREGTAASKLPGRIHGTIARNRSEEMRQALADSHREYEKRFINRQTEVLWESFTEKNNGKFHLYGLSGNYLPVCAWSSENLWNKISQVKLVSISDTNFEAEIIN